MRADAPGIDDDTASVANPLSASRAMDAARLQTRGDLILLFTVQEEVGLRGMYAWFERNRRDVDRLVALDGNLGPVLYGALGAYWPRRSALPTFTRSRYRVATRRWGPFTTSAAYLRPAIS